MIDYEVPKGQQIYDACHSAWEIAVIKRDDVRFFFNEIELYAFPMSDPRKIVTVYFQGCRDRDYIATRQNKAEETMRDAAPDLLAALKDVLEDYQTFAEYNGDGGGYFEVRPEIIAARAAIAKAKPEAP